MAAHVADEIGSHLPLDEAPLSIAPLEAILVAAAGDRLQKAGRVGLASTVKYDRESAVPASSSSSIQTLVVTCLVRGVPSS